MKTKVVYIFLLGLVGFTACNKEETETRETTENNQVTLMDLADQSENGSSNFLKEGKRIDNTEIYQRLVAGEQDRATIWRPFPSGWGWDCVGCFGMCKADNPFPFPFPGEPVPFPFPWESIEHTSVAGVLDAADEGLKLQLFPRPEDLTCAITGDGSFPIENEIHLLSETCEIMGLPEGTFIEPGIYTANLGEEGAYESVTLNLRN